MGAVQERVEFCPDAWSLQGLCQKWDCPGWGRRVVTDFGKCEVWSDGEWERARVGRLKGATH